MIKNRVNHQIRVPNVRLVKEGKQLGIYSTKEALNMALNAGLDLVEIAFNSNPPVCEILDFGKYKYEKNRQEKQKKKNQKEIEVKELRLRPVTEEHDIEVKLNHAKKFLSEGKKVRFVIKYKSREITHKEEGFRIIESILDSLSEVAAIEQRPSLQGKALFCLVVPK